MELWIRSQNRELLVQVNMVYIDEHYMICDGRTNILGEYETMKRALEVLDEIYDRLEEVDVTLKDNPKKEAVIGTVKTYEMPLM